MKGENEKSGRIRFGGEWDREFCVSAGELARMQRIVREQKEAIAQLERAVGKIEAAVSDLICC